MNARWQSHRSRLEGHTTRLPSNGDPQLVGNPPGGDGADPLTYSLGMPSGDMVSAHMAPNDPHVLDDLIVLFGGDAAERAKLTPRRDMIVQHLVRCEECQVALAALLEAGARTTALSDAQRAQLGTFYDRLARGIRGPHLSEARALYGRYVSAWLDHGTRPLGADTESDLAPVIRHLERDPECDEAVRRDFSARLAARVRAALESPPASAIANQAALRFESVSADNESRLHWRMLAREVNPIAVHAGMRLTDYETYDIEVEQQAAGELTLVVWGVDRLHGNRRRTLKLLRPEYHNDPTLRQAFVGAALEWCHVAPSHRMHAAPQLVPVPAFDDALAVLVTYAPHTLASALDVAHRSQPLTLAQAFGWAQQIAADLAALHRQKRPDGVTPYIHGDLKPGNILISDEATTWLSDVGMEKVWAYARDASSPRVHLVPRPSGATGEDEAVQASLLMIDPQAGPNGPVVGTPRYMSPERWLGVAENGPKGDVYAFGIVLHEMFSGVAGGPFVPHARSAPGWFRLHRGGRTRTLLDPESAALTHGPLAELVGAGGRRGAAEHRAAALQVLGELDLLVHRCLAVMPGQRPSAFDTFSQLAELSERLGVDREPAPPADPAHAGNPEHLRRLARSYGRAGQLERERDLLLAAAARGTASPELWISVGSSLHDQGYDTLALRAYAAAETLVPTHHGEHDAGDQAAPHVLAFHRGNAYRALGEHSRAVAEYGKTLAHQEAHVPALLAASDALSQLAAAANGPDDRRAHLHAAREHADKAVAQAHGRPHPNVLEMHAHIKRADDDARRLNDGSASDFGTPENIQRARDDVSWSA